jgi:hypothetical protein
MPLESRTANGAEPVFGTMFSNRMDGEKNCRSSSAEFSSAEGVPDLVAAPESSGPKNPGDIGGYSTTNSRCDKVFRHSRVGQANRYGLTHRSRLKATGKRVQNQLAFHRFLSQNSAECFDFDACRACQ